MTLLAIDEQGLHNLFRLASLASLEGYFYKPRIDRELLARHSAGLIGTTGCPGGEVQTWLRIGAVRRGPRRRGRAPRHLRSGPVLPGADGPRARRRGQGPGRPDAAARRPRPAARSRPTTCTTRTSGDADAHEVLLCVQSGKTMADPKRFKFDGSRLLPQVPGGDAPGLAGAAGGVRQHAAGRRAGVRLRRRVQLPRPDAALPGARRARPRTAGWSPRSSAGWPGGSRAACRRRTASRRSTSSASSPRWASRATSWSSPTCAGTPGSPASGSARAAGRPPAPWWRTRWASPSSTRSQHRPALRALPQPGADLDARHRPGLRRAPARRHDPLRDREVRRGAGRADHHVRHDQGQAGGQGLGPGARLPVLAPATGSPR